MKTILRSIKGMRVDAVIGDFAIGGEVAAALYLEPFSVRAQFEVYLDLPIAATAELAVEGWSVRFLPAKTKLELDALRHAADFEIEAVHTMLMSAEHVAAICLQNGGARNWSIALEFIEQDVVSPQRLRSLLEVSGLSTEWRTFQRQFRLSSGTKTRHAHKDERRRHLRELSLTEKVPLIEELRDAHEILSKSRKTASQNRRLV